jgi:hypothetical protein
MTWHCPWIRRYREFHQPAHGLPKCFLKHLPLLHAAGRIFGWLIWLSGPESGPNLTPRQHHHRRRNDRLLGVNGCLRAPSSKAWRGYSITRSAEGISVRKSRRTASETARMPAITPIT